MLLMREQQFLELQEISVEEIYVENGGSGYSAGDIVVFEDGGTEGGGAEGIADVLVMRSF